MLLCDRIARVAAIGGDPARLGVPREARAMPAIAHQVAACAALARDLSGATVRYVLGDDVVEAATNVVVSRPASIRDCVGAMRVPWPTAWVEWREPARIAAREALGIAVDNGMDMAERFGFLVEADPEGRRGRVRFAWSHPGPGWEAEFPTVSAHALRFDLDLAVSGSGRAPPEAVKRGSDLYRRWARSPADLAALDAMNGACWFEHSPEAIQVAAALASVSGFRPGVASSEAALKARMDALLRDVASEGLPLVATLMLLTARNAVEGAPEDRSRLNRARARKGEPPLLDHVTARLRLGHAAASRAPGAGGEAERGARRAHAVKGHFVARSGTIFWRRAHTRGLSSGLPPAATRTVTVSL